MFLNKLLRICLTQIQHGKKTNEIDFQLDKTHTHTYKKVSLSFYLLKLLFRLQSAMQWDLNQRTSCDGCKGVSLSYKQNCLFLVSYEKTGLVKGKYCPT